MLKNIYAPLSGGVAQERLLEILANNMANSGTNGFKEDLMSFRSLEADPWPNYASPIPPAQFKQNMSEAFPLRGNEMEYVSVSEVKTDFGQGPVRTTGSNLDFAIQGEGFFVVMTPFGERFTRDGSFGLTPDGMLVTKNGGMVQGEKGAIVGLDESSLRVLPSGEVYSGSKYVDKIKTVGFQDKTSLQRLGSNLWVHDGPPSNMTDPRGQLTQGALESSNVNPMKNMTAMIVAHRTYEALQKAVKAHDDSMGLSSTKIGDLNS